MRAILVGPMADASSSGFKKLFAALNRGGDDLLVAVDGGLVACRRLRLKPDVAIGDWDSLPSREALSTTPHLTLRRGKDRSDLFYACQAAVSFGASELVCVGVTGGRPDHHLATLMDLSWIESKTRGLRAVTAIGPEGRYFFVSRRHSPAEFRFPMGQVVSVFALGGPARGVVLKGFRYKLRAPELSPSSHGLSNEVTRPVCGVSVERGRLVVMAIA